MFENRSRPVSLLLWIVPLLALFAAAAAWTVPHRSDSPRTVAGQDPGAVYSGVIAEEARWRFAELAYRSEADTTIHVVAARDLQKIWMLVRPDGGTVLELLYENDDYKIVQAAEVLFRHRSKDAAQREITVFRRPINGMAFPTLR